MAKSSPYRGVTLFRPTGKWRAQISALGRTVSLGDHDTEEGAAQAFDRAAINKGGRTAKTNFPMTEYEAEVTELTGLSQEDLVTMLRSQARKSTVRTSSYRGVSLLKQTGKWHAQINIGGKQVHLGFFLTEQLAAKAYDRAAINKSMREKQKVATNFDMSTYTDEVEVLTAMDQDEFVTALADEERRKGLMDMLGQGFTVQGARTVFGSSFMHPPGGKGSSAQGRAPKAHRELQALQRDASASLSASTGKVSTRKRKLAESPSDPAATAAAAAPAVIEATQATSSVQAPQAPQGTDTAGQPASQGRGVESAAVKNGRRSSSRNAHNTSAGKQAATYPLHVVPKLSEVRHREASTEAIGHPATAVGGGASSHRQHHPETQPGHPQLSEGVGQAGAVLAAAQPKAVKARLRHSSTQPTPRTVKLEEPEAAAAEAQARLVDGVEVTAAGGTAGSERDKRVAARQTRTAAGSKSKPGIGTPEPASAAAGTPFQAPEAQQATAADQTSAGPGTAAAEPLPAPATATTAKLPKRAKRAKAAGGGTHAVGVAGKSSGALSEANGSHPEAAAATAERDFVDSTAAAAAAAAAENMTGSQSSGVMAATQGTGEQQNNTGAAGKAGSVKGNSNLNGARAGIGGTAGTPSAVSDAHPLTETSAAAGLPVAAQDATPSALSVKANDTGAKTSAPIQASLAEGVPTGEAESAASAKLEQLANTAGGRNTAAAGLLPTGPGQAAPDAGLMANAPSQRAPVPLSAAAKPGKGQSSQQLPVHFPSSSPVNGAKVAPHVAGKAQLLAVPAKTGVAPASTANGDWKRSDEAGQAANVQQKSSPTLLADPQVSQQADEASTGLPTPVAGHTHQPPSSTHNATPPTHPASQPGRTAPAPISSPPFGAPSAVQSLRSVPATAAALYNRDSDAYQASHALTEAGVSGPAATEGTGAPPTAVSGVTTLRGGTPGNYPGGYPSAATAAALYNRDSDAYQASHALTKAGVSGPAATEGTGAPPTAVSGVSTLRGGTLGNPPGVYPKVAVAANGVPVNKSAVPAGARQLNAGASSNNVRATDLLSGGHTPALGRKPEAAGASPGLASSTKSMTASSAIAAAARANAAAASAIAESGNTLGRSKSGFAHSDDLQADVGAIHPITPANSPSAHLPTGPAASHNGATQVSPVGSDPPGAFAAARVGSLGAGHTSALSASQSASQAAFLSQQQRLNGMAMMNAMHESLPATSAAQAPAQAASAAPRLNSYPNMPAPGQQTGSNPRSGSMQGSQSFLNPNGLPASPAPFRNSSSPSFRGAGPPSGASANPSFAPSSSALHPTRVTTSAGIGANPMYPGGSSKPFMLWSQPSSSNLTVSVPNPSSSKASGPQSPGNPMSPSHRPQGLHASAPEAGSAHQGFGQAAAQVPWPHARPPFRGMLSQAHANPTTHPALPAGAQVTPTTSRAQQSPQLAAQSSMALEMQALQSRGMTNAHAIVPGMLPSSVGRGSNTAWQVGLAAGLAATANLRPPNASVGHQAATTAAAARAAAAFQASRAMAKSQHSPLPQPGSATAGASAATGGTNLAGPSTTPFTSQGPTAVPSGSLITDGSATAIPAGKVGSAVGTAGSGVAAAAMNMAAPATTAAINGGPLATADSRGGHPQIASHQAFARQGLPASLPTAVATSANQSGTLPPAMGLTGPPSMSTALPGRPLPQQAVATAYSTAGQTPYSAEAQALYRARAQAQPQFSAQPRPYVAQSQTLGSLPQSQYVSLSQPPYNVQTHTPYIAPSQLPYMAQGQAGFKPQLQPQPAYGIQPQAQYSTAAMAQQRYAVTAAQRYAAPSPQLAQPRGILRPPLHVEHVTFAKLAPQPTNAIDIICEDAVLPSFPLKKKKPKKRKYAGLEIFAAEVHRHKRMARDSTRNILQCHLVKKSPMGRPPKDFRPRMTPTARQTEQQQQLAKASSVTSLALKPKGKAAKGPKGKAAAAKGRKGDALKKSERVIWDSQKRRAVEGVPAAGRQFANASRLHQEHTGTTGMDQLLGALGHELEAYEAEEGSDTDDGAVSGTDQGGPNRGSASRPSRGGISMKRGRGAKTVAKVSVAGRGRGSVKQGRGAKVATAARGGKGHKRAASSSPDRGPARTNHRRKTQAPSRAS